MTDGPGTHPPTHYRQAGQFWVASVTVKIRSACSRVMPYVKGDPVHPVAVKCIKWAVGLFIFGGLMSAYGTDFLVWLSDRTGATGIAGFTFMNVLFGILQWSLMPLAGSLVGAAVVIQTLAPHMREVDNTDFDETEVEAGGRD